MINNILLSLLVITPTCYAEVKQTPATPDKEQPYDVSEQKKPETSKNVNAAKPSNKTKSKKAVSSNRKSEKKPTYSDYFDLSAGVGQYMYDEPTVMNLRGPLLSFALKYHREGSEGSLIGKNYFSEINFAHQFVNGEYRSIETGSMKNSDSSISHIEYLVGKHFKDYDVKLGLGYRYLSNDTTGRVSTTGHYGYDREQTYTYMPLEFDYYVPFKNKGIIEFGVGSNIFISGHNRSMGFMEFDQEEGYNINAHAIYREGPYFAKFEVSFWDVEDSDYACFSTTSGKTRCFVEPENNTQHYEFSVGYRF